MSIEAMRWAWRNMDVDSPGALAVLLVLADHAGEHDGEDWTCFPAVSLIAPRTRLTERAVERHLLWLIERGWVTRVARGVRQVGKGKFTYTLHRQRVDRTGSASPDKSSGQKGRASPAKLSGQTAPSPDKMSGQNGPISPVILSGDRVASPDNLAAFTRQKRPSPPHPPYIAEPPDNPHSLGAGDEAFEEVWSAWARTIPDGVARPTDLKAWRASVAKIAPPDLAAAALAYLARSPGVKRGRGKSLRRWLEEEGWLPWRGEVAPVARAWRGSWPGPPEIRAAVLAECGEGFVGSYLDPSAWDDARRVITPRTGVARDALRGCRALWKRMDVTIGERAAASLAKTGGVEG